MTKADLVAKAAEFSGLTTGDADRAAALEDAVDG